MPEIQMDWRRIEMKIEYITYLNAFTDKGYRKEVDLIGGNTKVGSQVIRTTKAIS